MALVPGQRHNVWKPTLILLMKEDIEGIEVYENGSDFSGGQKM